MKKISPKKALFIKLGQRGCFEEESMKKNILKLDYRESNHDFCMAGKWDKVKKELDKHNTKGVATFHLNQIKYFYEEGEDVLWITFCHNKLYWCFADKKVVLEKDGTKYRKVNGKWKCVDIEGNTLFKENLNGRLIAVQGFKATICRVAEFDYLVDKINSAEPKDIKETEQSFNNLKENLSKIIKKLQPKEFELLVDLIFGRAGWQRVGKIGGPQAIIDIIIAHPITNERAAVQVKCRSKLSEYKEYEKKFMKMTEYDKFFYIVHTPESSLENYKDEPENMNIYFVDKITELSINSGLYHWILKIAG